MKNERLIEIEAIANTWRGIMLGVSDTDIFDTKKAKAGFLDLISNTLELATEVRRQREEIGQLNLKIALRCKNEEAT